MTSSNHLLSGKICMVTGSNTGIGKATAMGLARMNAAVVMVCRDRRKGEAARDEIRAKTGNPCVDLMIADLSSQQAIRQLAEDFKSRHDRLHVLVNNAGIIRNDRALSVDGIEMTLAVNHLAYFLLTNLLLDVLKQSAPARVINVASKLHSDTLNFNNLQGEQTYSAVDAYARSKLCNILFTYELARRLEGTGVTANCLHPGVIRTNLIGGFFAGAMKPLYFMSAPFFASPEKGARTSIYLASSPAVAGVTGKYFIDSKGACSSAGSYDLMLAARLWQKSAELTSLESV
ncbi:MAG TPA: SDR family oxidoreductase [Blastocatellia bacterium]|nr:SDR family oxidoreductase [Blastocatellia bacterium]